MAKNSSSKKQDKAPAKKKVHAKPTLKKGQPFAALSKGHKRPSSNAAKATVNKTVQRPTKHQELQRKQRLDEQKNFEERMNATNLRKERAASAPAFVMAPPTFSFLGASNPFVPVAAPAPTSALDAFMQPLMATEQAPTVAPVRVQARVSKPKNVFAALQDDDDDDEMAPPPMLFQMKPASFRIAPPMFDPDL
ncbi:hypothetical protein SDRG_17008 [Saprolegnia diclina VS20]|uniref:Uncharacterized protein n=1 Tax=Saprolegnia diclina (strain VS20) TaxID=1156394 RepID=T0QZD4_SAPDV|nr:hypothetical protein SDRG_17008 [Saprolegnia diclina VS20]EQC25113.1 hypothetical protein SDRG_17008 [Saprolegnia diclina VS20]|eukprot:XP_008621463.1 hypothetical protein SDRG_17008 [Saprolegnia diclina VS20]